MDQVVTRAAEFCYIAERADGAYLMAIIPAGERVCYTEDPELALRISEPARKGVAHTVQLFGFGAIGFRKILAG